MKKLSVLVALVALVSFTGVSFAQNAQTPGTVVPTPVQDKNTNGDATKPVAAKKHTGTKKHHKHAKKAAATTTAPAADATKNS